MNDSENHCKEPCTSTNNQPINFADLKQKASELLNNALNDPECHWVILGDEERQMIKDRCQTLFKWFCHLPLSSLSDHTAVNGVNYEQNSLDEPCFELSISKYVVERYIEKGSMDFEREFDMEIDQLIVSLLYGIWEDHNKGNINFAPLCEALQMDKSTYNMVKQFLREEDNGRKTAKNLIEETFCTPIDCCLTLTMAYCEASGWPLNVDWSSIKFSEEEWLEEDFYEFDRIVREEAARQWEVQKLFPQGESEVVTMCLNLEREVGIITSAVDKAHTELQQLMDSMKAQDLKLNREAIARHRNSQIANLAPDFQGLAPLTTDELKQIEAECNEARARMNAIHLYSEWPKAGGLQNRLLLQSGQLCLARADRDDTLNLSEARVLNRTSTFVYHLAFLENASTEDVNPVDIAVPSLPLYDPDVKRTNYIGLRVAAMVKNPYCGDQPVWWTGTIGNTPNLTHNKEFLIFFDDGFDLYVKAPFDSCDEEARITAKLTNDSEITQFRNKIALLKILPLARQSIAANGIDIDKGSVYQLIQQNPERRRFIQKYFEKYPDWPLVRMKKPAPPERPAQAIMAYDRHHQRTNTYVVHVDRSMCVLRFPTKSTSILGACCSEYPCPHNHPHNDELLFRGSSRLHAVALENFGNNNMSARRMAKNRSQFDVVQPDRTVPEKTKPTARKSSIPVPRNDGGSPYLHSQYEDSDISKMDPREVEQRKRRENLYKVVPRNSICQLPLRCQTYHDECSSECLHGLDSDPYDQKFQTCSPLHIPMMSGWQRIMYLYQLPGKHKGGDKRILYRAPCGRSFTSMDLIAKFLRESDSELTIDLFTFDPLVDTHTFVEVPENSVKSSDYAKGLEQMPIPAINMVDDEEPPQIFYGARRFPYNDQVDVSTISRDFCSGCTCEDDCSNPTQCECQQLTRSNVMRLASSFRPKEFGYRNRILQGITISGIFECNDNCGCHRKRCFNRVVQHPIKYPIQIYKTAQSGWGVRALTDIPKGAFIANYVGALLTDSIADTLKKGEDEYFADLDLNDAVENEKAASIEELGYLDGGLGSSDEEDERGKKKKEVADDDGLGSDVSSAEDSADEEKPRYKRGRPKKKKKDGDGDGDEKEKVPRRKKLNPAELEKIDAAAAVRDEDVFKWADYFGEDNTLYVIDAKKKGNVGRFLNHSCDPNVYVQHVFVDTHDLRLPWSSFFSKRKIKAGEELCWNYGYSPDSLNPDRPKHLQLFCKCGAENCQGRLL